jgi:hypothetical protein
MARKCHIQDHIPVLISSVSSSGGGLPGRPGLVRVSGRSLFFFWANFLDARPALGHTLPRPVEKQLTLPCITR